MISGYLFDLDGTLFDTTAANIAAYKQAFAKAGVSFDEKKYESLFGLRFNEIIKELAPRISKQTQKKIRTLKVDYYKSNMHLIRPNFPLLGLLKDVSLTHPTALVTTASIQNVDNILSYFNLPKTLFGTIITGENVSNGKPDPECYETALRTLQINPAECIVFEDSSVGVQAARAAGAQVIQIKL